MEKGILMLDCCNISINVKWGFEETILGHLFWLKHINRIYYTARNRIGMAQIHQNHKSFKNTCRYYSANKDAKKSRFCSSGSTHCLILLIVSVMVKNKMWEGLTEKVELHWVAQKCGGGGDLRRSTDTKNRENSKGMLAIRKHSNLRTGSLMWRH